MMTVLDLILPTPCKLERYSVELALPEANAWALVRHGDLARSRLVKALLAIRTLPLRLSGTVNDVELRIGALASSPERPGFQILFDDPREVVVGAIRQVWQLDIPFVKIPDTAANASFTEAGWVKVAWRSACRQGAKGAVAWRWRCRLTQPTMPRGSPSVAIGSRLVQRRTWVAALNSARSYVTMGSSRIRRTSSPRP
jgi:hypothetical protein